jgi:hypothetical protein
MLRNNKLKSFNLSYHNKRQWLKLLKVDNKKKLSQKLIKRLKHKLQNWKNQEFLLKAEMVQRKSINSQKIFPSPKNRVKNLINNRQSNKL